jgi:ketosteroid isomerase-like protein
MALALGAACAEAPEELSEQDRQTIAAAFDSTVSYMRARNFAAWAALHAEDVIFQPSNGPAVLGRQGLAPWAEAFPAMEEFSFSNVQVKGTDDLAYGTSDYSLKLQGLPPDNGKQLVVFRRNAAGTWEVVATSFNSNLPLPMPDTTAARKP